MLTSRIGLTLIIVLILAILFTPQVFSQSIKIIQISAAGQSCVALAGDGSVWEWGSNWRGELTGNSSDGHQAPIRVPIDHVVAVSAGGFENLALSDDGTVWAWGSLESNISKGTFTPVQIPISGVKSIYAGEAWCFAIKNDNTVWAWGENNGGQLGDGTYTSRSTPVQIPLTNIRFICPNSDAIFAVDNDGSVWGWGSNFYVSGDNSSHGRISNYLTDEYYPTPVKLANLHGVNSISSGMDFVLVLENDGRLSSWGANDKGQLGTGTVADSVWQYFNMSFVLNNVKAMSAGYEDSVALKNDGIVWIWGIEENHTLDPSPRQVPGISDVVAVSAGYTHYMALKSDGTVWVFGGVGKGQAGKDTGEDYLYTPVKVDINFSSQAYPANTSSSNTTIMPDQFPESVNNQTTRNSSFNGTQIPTPMPGTSSSPDVRVIGVIGLIVLAGCVLYLMKRK